MGPECVRNIFNGCQATNDQSIIYTVYWQISDIKEHQRVIIVISWILRKESLNSDGQQFYQYQQNVQPPLNSLNIKKKRLWYIMLEINALGWDRHKTLSWFALLGMLPCVFVCKRMGRRVMNIGEWELSKNFHINIISVCHHCNIVQPF